MLHFASNTSLPQEVSGPDGLEIQGGPHELRDAGVALLFHADRSRPLPHFLDSTHLGVQVSAPASPAASASIRYLQEEVELEVLNGSPTLKDLTSHVEENHPSSATQCWMTSALKHWRSVLSKVSSASRRPAAHRSQVNYDLIFERHSWYLRSGGSVLAAQTHSKGRGPKNPSSFTGEGGPRTPGADEQDVAWASSAPRLLRARDQERGLLSGTPAPLAGPRSLTEFSMCPRSGAWAALRCKAAGDALLLGAPEPDRGLKVPKIRSVGCSQVRRHRLRDPGA